MERRHRQATAIGVAWATALWASGAAAQGVAPYDPGPLLESMQPAAREDLVRAAGPAHRLPLYDLTLRLADNGRDFTLHEVVTVTNTERAPLRELVFRVYGNATRPQGATPAAGGPTPAGGATLAGPPVQFVRGSCEGAGCTVRAETPSVIAVRPGQPLAPGATTRITLDLTGTLPEIAPGRTDLMTQGLESLATMGAASEGGGDYGVLATGDGIISLANFYPVLGRRTAGRWERVDRGGVGDFGSDALSHVRATLDFPAGYVVATTGITARTVAAGGGRQRHEVVAGGVRDFAVLTGRTLQMSERRVGTVDVRSYFLPAHREAGERVLDTAARSLEEFARRFGPYPYRDLDVVEAPLVGGAGGVEFPGLVTVATMFYRPTRAAPSRVPAAGGASGGGAGGLGGILGGLLGGAGGDAAGGGGLGAILGALGGGGGGGIGGLLGGLGDTSGMLAQMLPSMLEFVTAHEVAHQYWHGLVGSDSREHPFIDESLAQYSAMLYVEARHGAARARREADMQVRMNYQFMRMLGHPDGAVDRPAHVFTSPIAYAGLVYGKGPYLYDALRREAGDAVFFRALRRYADTWRFRTAPPSGFLDALSAEHPARAARYRALGRRWLQESHGDEDLGPGDLGTIMTTMMGGQGAIDPQMQQMLQGLGPVIQQVLRGTGAGPSGPQAPPTPGTPTAPGTPAGGPQRVPWPGTGGTSPGGGGLERVLEQLLQGLD